MLIRTTTGTGQGVPQVDTSVRGADFHGHQRLPQMAKTADFLMAMDIPVHSRKVLVRVADDFLGTHTFQNYRVPSLHYSGKHDWSLLGSNTLR